MDMQGIQYGGFGGDHAVVMGASTTGLVSAAAIARHFRRVTVVERDTLPGEPVWRKGAPQSRHVHVLLRGGRNVMDHYLPGFTTHMIAQDAQLIDMAGDAAWYHSGGWKLRFDSGVTLLSASKGFLEWNLRQRVLKIPNVTIIDQCGGKNFVFADGKVRGVALEDGRVLDADLVVDASGRASRTPQWLEAAGFGAPDVTELAVDVGYASRTYKPADTHVDWRALFVHPKHPDTRCAVLLPIEGNRWQVTLVGWRGDHPPADDAAFLEWTAGLATPTFLEAIKHAEPLDPIRQWRFPSNLRRHYDRFAAMPGGLVVVGDASVSINPIYAQGMSHGAIGASILDECLFQHRGASPGDAALTRSFQGKYAKLIDECWLTSTAEDYGAVDASAAPSLRDMMLNWYMGKINTMTWSDRDVAKAFLDVMHFQKSPKSLFSPSLFMRALFN